MWWLLLMPRPMTLMWEAFLGRQKGKMAPPCLASCHRNCTRCHHVRVIDSACRVTFERQIASLDHRFARSATKWPDTCSPTHTLPVAIHTNTQAGSLLRTAAGTHHTRLAAGCKHAYSQQLPNRDLRFTARMSQSMLSRSTRSALALLLLLVLALSCFSTMATSSADMSATSVLRGD